MSAAADKKLALAQRLLDHAQANYDKGGWDVWVECFSPADVVEKFWGEYAFEPLPVTWKAVLAEGKECASLWDERQQDARISSGEGGGW